MKILNKKGFSLIEIMVIVAIIGILTSIVVFNVRSAEKKARDAAIQSLMFQIKTIAEEIYLIDYDYDAVCDDSDNTLSNEGKFGVLESEIKKQNNNQDPACYENEEKTSFAVSSPLVGERGKHWCISFSSKSVKLDNSISTSTCE